jgi:hypothetical protein
MAFGCASCGGSGWMVGAKDKRAIPTARRCDCMGGPDALATYLRNCKPPDYKLAESLERDERVRRENRKFKMTQFNEFEKGFE